MKRNIVVGDVTICDRKGIGTGRRGPNASQGHLQRCHSGHLRIVLVRQPFLVTYMLPV